MKRLLIALLLVLPLAAAQQAQAPTVATAANATYGVHLTDADGNSLYLYLKDEGGASACVDACANNWPPLVVEGEPVAGEGVDAALLGVVARADGSLQVTYNGWPLYRYVRDAQPGAIAGQKLGNLFFLLGAGGDALTEAAAPEKVEISDADFEALMAEGAAKFTSICAACHGASGEGRVGPKLDGNPVLGDTTFLANRILNGFVEHGMPSFRDLFTDREIAAVATYVRNSWTNDFGAVLEEEVVGLR